MKKLLRFVVMLLLLALLLTPLAGIYALTKQEMAQYNEIYVPAVVQKSYGAPVPVYRMDMQESITLTGTFVSTERSYMELPSLRNVYSARLLVEVGDYIAEGDLIGYTEDGKTELYATAEGVIQELHLGATSYITLESTQALALRCMLNEASLEVLERDGLALTDKDGRDVTILEIGKQTDAEGLTEVLLTGLSGRYGQTVKELRLNTGMVYTQALVAPTKCLFRQPGEKAWCVRIVTEDGNLIGIQEIQVGFSNGEYTCVTGLDEGVWLDSGYAAVFGGGSDAGTED